MKRSFVKKLLKLMAMASAALLPLHAQAQQQTPAATGTAPTALASPSQTQKHIEAYLRNLTKDPLAENLALMRISEDRKSTRLNSSHVAISYAVFCLKKKKKTKNI